MNNNIKTTILSIGFVLSIVVVIAFAVSVKEKIRAKKKFSGTKWGIVNGIAGPGLLWVMIAHNSINKEIALITDKKYKKFVQEEMRNFVKNYALFLIIWIIIGVFIWF